MSDVFDRPFRLAVRDRGEWIDAILCVNDPGSEDLPDAFVVSKLSKVAAQKDRQIFEDWVKVLTAFTNRAVQSITGIEVVKTEIIRLGRPSN